MAWSNLYTIEIYLNNQTKLISFYKNMKTDELYQMIRFAFNIEETVDIIGIQDQQQRIIPLSYLALDPRRLNQQERYRILTNPIQQFYSIPQPESWCNKRKCYRLLVYIFSALLLLIGIISFYFAINFIYSSYKSWIRYLYFYGPGIYLIGTGIQLGGWSGTNHYLICAKLTDTSTKLWYDATQECHEMIERNIQSITVGIEVLAVIFIIYQGLKITRYSLFTTFSYLKSKIFSKEGY